MDKTTHQIRCEQWTKIINECLASGMNKTAWCRENGISVKSFFYWQRILRNEAYIIEQVPAAAPTSEGTPVAFVELKSLPSGSDPTLFQPDIIIRKGGVALEISNTASPELLKHLGGLIHA